MNSSCPKRSRGSCREGALPVWANEDGQLLIEHLGDYQEIAISGVSLTRFDALEGPSADAGLLTHRLLGVVSSGPEITDADAQFATSLSDPI